MSTTFVKTSTGVQEVGRSRIRNYDSVECVLKAIEDGELRNGDLFTTVAAHGITEDIESVINCLVSITPNTASPSNMLVTQDQLTFIGDVTALQARVCQAEEDISTNASNIATNTSLVNQLGARVQVTENNLSCKVDCDDYTQGVAALQTAIGSKADQTSVTTALGLKVNCTDFDTLQSDVSAIDTSVSNTATRVSNLSNCAGLDCTGTLVAADIAGLTDCVGTVTAICNSNGTKHNPDENGLVTVAFPVITVSGTVMTITA